MWGNRLINIPKPVPCTYMFEEPFIKVHHDMTGDLFWIFMLMGMIERGIWK